MAEDLLRHFFGGFVRMHVLYHAAKEPVWGAAIMAELDATAIVSLPARSTQSCITWRPPATSRPRPPWWPANGERTTASPTPAAASSAMPAESSANWWLNCLTTRQCRHSFRPRPACRGGEAGWRANAAVPKVVPTPPRLSGW